ncbi:unnamed protein product, partial [Allacma fusca]
MSGEITKAKPNALTEKETFVLSLLGSKKVNYTLSKNVSSVEFNSKECRMYSCGDTFTDRGTVSGTSFGVTD